MLNMGRTIGSCIKTLFLRQPNFRFSSTKESEFCCKDYSLTVPHLVAVSHFSNQGRITVQ